MAKSDEGCGCSWWMWAILCLICYQCGADDGYKAGYKDAQQKLPFVGNEAR